VAIHPPKRQSTPPTSIRAIAWPFNVSSYSPSTLQYWVICVRRHKGSWTGPAPPLGWGSSPVGSLWAWPCQAHAVRSYSLLTDKYIKLH